MNRAVLLLASSSILVGVSVCTAAWGQTDYQMIDLGSGWPTDINSGGQVVGVSQSTYGGPMTGYLWQSGATTSLGVVLPSGINSGGQIVGTDPKNRRACIWQNGVITTLPSLPYPYTQAEAYGINITGQIVGECYTSTRHVACLWENGVITTLPSFGGNYSIARGINDAGQIVGSAFDASANCHAALWQSGSLTDIGRGSALCVNNDGWVVCGLYGMPGGCVWKDGGIYSLGGLDAYYDHSTPADINKSGQIVGSSNYITSSSNLAKPCIWQNGTISELPRLPGYAQGTAVAINDNGQIVGYCYSHATSLRHGVLWQPVSEPCTFLAILCGLGGLAWRRRS